MISPPGLAVSREVCYNVPEKEQAEYFDFVPERNSLLGQNVKGGFVMKDMNIYWKMFEQTGSVAAYIVYRQFGQKRD